ncbi:MAG TPA: hypothetical protein VH331_09200 [Allosphingosinicella sp.]|nr:hypothetical protein [Allosphingosinicella sp.]
MDMTDEQFATYRARISAAESERREGEPGVAASIGDEKADDHWRVRLALFFLAPTEHDAEFYAEWDRLAKAA